MLFRVAKALDSSKYEQLSREVFLLYLLPLETLPTNLIASGRDVECLLLLGRYLAVANITRFANFL